jgi:hypothetical protein
MEIAVKFNRRCVKTIFDRKILCVGTMTDYMTIKKREQVGIGPDQNDTSATEGFTDVIAYMGYMEAVKPTARFDGVYIDSATTHVGYIPFDQTTYELDNNSLFVELERSRNRLFKMQRIMNFGEQDEYLALFLTETGFIDLQAAEG